MKTSGNTILITGGGSGIGREFAETFHKLGNKVIIAGRRELVLSEVTRANPGMASQVLDIEDPNAVRAFATKIKADFPNLNVIIHSAGVMKMESLLNQQHDLADVDSTVAINLLGPMRLNAALLPFLVGQPRSTIMTVTSGLAFVPRSSTPTYCATKAAIHSYTLSLRYQLRDTSTQVLELVPPYVQTGLTGERQARDPRAMPLKEFVAEAMQILENSPEAVEICVERVKPLRFAERSGDFDAFFKKFNDTLAAAEAAAK